MIENVKEVKAHLISRGLTKREAEVAEMVALGFTSQRIADKLFITIGTVKYHITNVYKKMGMNRRAQLIIFLQPYLSKDS